MEATASYGPPNLNKGPGILAVSWIEAGVGLVVLSARIYTRSRIVRNMGWDDWTMVFATILALVTTILVTLEVNFGVGRHAIHLEPQDVISAVKIIWLTVPFSTMSACFGKISISLLLMQIINRNRAGKIFLSCLIITLFIVNLLLTIITFAQCRPVTFLWDKLNPHVGYAGKCWSPDVQKNYGYFQGAFSSASDLALAIFPVPIIWKLQMKLRVKLGLAAVLSLGVVAAAAACIKTVELRNLATPDFTWDATDLVYWYITENWIIVIAACIPTLAPLYSILRGKQSRESFLQQGRHRHRLSFDKLKTWFGSWKFHSLFSNRSSEHSPSLTKSSQKDSGLVCSGDSFKTVVPAKESHLAEGHNELQARNQMEIEKTTQVSIV
ncbi:hypothetical protein EV356DRAFT_532582 [Viridothelium virens]|uniref:Rhodopsin domain-containing protein n=1 Tax=Viridothelium virens TaxID=1048519 RepID=A0A6A6H9T1_VIRVR|nr:hypothetical protein EV356DRAFT_532582 [Viridothelium virens]